MTPAPHPLDLADAILKRRRGVVVLDELYVAVAKCLREQFEDVSRLDALSAAQDRAIAAMHAELMELRAKPAEGKR